MEELINKLIEKGWKPRGIYTSLIVGYGLVRCEEYVGSPRNERKSYRELVSKESGLRQFCCDNKLIKSNGYCNGWVYHDEYDEYDEGDGMNNEEDLQRYYDTNYQYYVIECALRNEQELEQFLLENIEIQDDE